MGPFLFWDMTLGEIRHYIKQQSEKAIRELKSEIMNIDTLANRIAECIAPLFSDSKVKNMYEYYPVLFEEELRVEQEKQREYEMTLRKERMKDLVEEQNTKNLKERGEENS